MKAVVFDWDGTLVDSQTAYVAAWRSSLAEVGYIATQEDLQYVVGRAFPDCLQYFVARASIDASSFERRWRKDFRHRMEAGIPVYPDALESARTFVSMGIPLAIATQTPRPEFERALTITGLKELADVTVCRTDVDRPKPAPDLYLEACHRLMMSPGDCLAIEDSLVGITSAREAGLKVVGVARTATVLTLLDAAADLAVTTLNASEMLRHFRLCREET